MNTELITLLEKKAVQIRKETCEMIHLFGGGHIGGSLSITDICVALYYYYMKVDPYNPKWEDRDRLILSKGHSGGCLYNILADKGFFDRKLIIENNTKINGRFGQHPNRKEIPGIEVSTGSLGHGLSIAVGQAISARLSHRNNRIFVITGDGELQEGSNWEAAMAATKFGLGNLVWFIDRNRLQINGNTEEIMPLEPLEDKIRSFGWQLSVINGNNMIEVVDILDNLPPVNSSVHSKPIAVISNSIKGKGVDFMEDNYLWHLGSLDEEALQKAYESIDREYEKEGVY